MTRNIEEILNLTDDEMITNVLKKDSNGDYSDLLNRNLKVKEDLITFWHMVEDMMELFDYGLKVSTKANGFPAITFYPTQTTFYFDYLDDDKGKKYVTIKEQLVHVYHKMKESLNIEMIDLIKYIDDKKYSFVSSYNGGGIKDYSIGLYKTNNYGLEPKNEITIHMSSEVEDIDGFKELIDGIAEEGYVYLISLWYSDSLLLDSHKFAYQRWELYSLSLEGKDYYLFDIFNSRTQNAKHHFIVINHTYSDTMYKQVIEDKDLLDRLVPLSRTY